MKGRIIRPETSSLILPRIGHIKVGEKKDGLPRSLDYFKSTGKYSGLFDAAYPDKPNCIQILFLEDDAENVCYERYDYRDKEGRCFAYGDGALFHVWNGKKYVTATIDEKPDIMEEVKTHVGTGKEWSVILTLRFIIPKIQGIVGYWEFSTKGEASSIPTIRGAFDQMLEMNGFIKGIIWDLTVDYAKSQKPGVKSRYPVVNLITNESEGNKKLVENLLINVQKAIE